MVEVSLRVPQDLCSKPGMRRESRLGRVEARALYALEAPGDTWARQDDAP